MKRVVLFISMLLAAVSVYAQRPVAVDLGLTSGLKWASANVGAETQYATGDFFAWGETAPKAVYDWNTYKWSKGSLETITKYLNVDTYGGPVDDKTVLDPGDDPATVVLGGKWRTPTRKEFIELRRECDWIWVSENGAAGYEIRSKVNGNKIFLPAAGFWQDDHSVGVGLWAYGDYWTSSLGGGCPEFAFCITFNSQTIDWGTFERSWGFAIRAVTE